LLKLVFRALFRSARKQPRKASSSRKENALRATVVNSTKRTDASVSQCERNSLTNMPAELSGKCTVVDGDTIKIGKVSMRLAGIDAPELDHGWGQKAKWELVALCKGQTITARVDPDTSYDRIVATCFLPDGRDLSAEMVKMGLALDWPKFSGGKYASYEPNGVRKKIV